MLGTLLAITLVGLITYVGFLLEPAPEPAIPDTGYIDMHVHAGGLGEGDSGAMIGKQMRNSYKFPIYVRAFGVTKKEVEEHGDGLILERTAKQIEESLYIDKAVILALDGVINEEGELDEERTQFYVPNEWLIKELPKYPNLMFGASINPYRHDSLERLEHVASNGAVLIKWIPNIMLIDPSDERIRPFYQRMKELCLPLLSHTGAERAFAGADDRLGDPELLKLPLSVGVTVIGAHVGTTGSIDGETYFERIVRMFPQYPNLYTDISSLTQINKMGYMKTILRLPHVEEKLLYGTDWPLQFFPIVSPYFQLDSISLREARRVRSYENSWDRDVTLKKFMGIEEDVFRRYETLMDSCEVQQPQS